MQDFIDAAVSTKSEQFFGERVGLFYFLDALRKFIKAADELDAIKKSLFYGRKLHDIDEGHTWGGVNLALLADRVHPDIIHAIIGGATETSEQCEALAKLIEAMLMGRPAELDLTNLKEEAGDQLWYLAVLFKRLGTNFSTEGKRVIAKLMQRYPDGFSKENAIVRDLIAERAILESDPA